MKISQMGLILVALPLVCELFFVGVLSYLQAQLESEMKIEIRSRNIIEHSDRLMIAVLSAGTATSSYGISMRDESSGENAIARYEKASLEASAQLRELFKLTADRPEQLAILNRISKTYDNYDKVAISAKGLFENFSGSAPSKLNAKLWDLVNTLNDDISTINHSMDEFLAGERQVEKESPRVQSRNRQLISVALFIGVAFNIVLAVGMVAFFSRRIVLRLNVIIDKTRQLAKGQELDKELLGNDEIVLVDHAFHEASRRLKELDRLKKEFVSMVSHDLRTPLTSIGGLLEFLEAGMLGQLTEKGKKQVAMAQNDAMRLIGLINDLLDIDKLESGKLEMHFGPVDIRTVISRSTAAVSSLSSSRKIEINVDLRDEQIIADADRLVQVVVNLLSNAIKFSPSPSTIEIDCVADSESATVRIRDHGRGIPASHLDLVFDRFSQVEIADSKKLGGSGLGLAICKQIIEQHNGTIGVESEEGRGSCFWFKLPRLQEVVQTANSRFSAEK